MLYFYRRSATASNGIRVALRSSKFITLVSGEVIRQSATLRSTTCTHAMSRKVGCGEWIALTLFPLLALCVTFHSIHYIREKIYQ